MYYNKVNQKLYFPDYIKDENTKDFLTKLLNKNPNRRLGSIYGFEELKDHSFLEGMDWIKILKK